MAENSLGAAPPSLYASSAEGSRLEGERAFVEHYQPLQEQPPSFLQVGARLELPAIAEVAVDDFDQLLEDLSWFPSRVAPPDTLSQPKATQTASQKEKKNEKGLKSDPTPKKVQQTNKSAADVAARPSNTPSPAPLANPKEQQNNAALQATTQLLPSPTPNPTPTPTPTTQLLRSPTPVATPTPSLTSKTQRREISDGGEKQAGKLQTAEDVGPTTTEFIPLAPPPPPDFDLSPPNKAWKSGSSSKKEEKKQQEAVEQKDDESQQTDSTDTWSALQRRVGLIRDAVAEDSSSDEEEIDPDWFN